MSVYQTNGRPLSQQALYQQKLKQGVFNSPGKPSVGVASSASDTAALLAASSDLSVKPSYERLQAAQEAQDAALAARFESIPAWSRGPADPQAGSAAANAKSPVGPSAPATELGIPSSYNRSSAYKQAAANSTSTMTSRITPEKSVSRHGLNSKPSPTTTLNIGKISQVADKNSSSLLDKRFNPANDYRSGITSKPTEFLTEEEELMAAESAEFSLSMKHGAGYTDSVSSQRRNTNFQASDVVDATLLAAASAKAKERLNSLNSLGESDLREQAQIYSKALTAAQKNSEERLKAHKAGMIDLGGGLTLPFSEVDKLASLIVQPVLDDLGAKANAQRDTDAAQTEKQLELKRLHLKFKKEDENRRHAEKVQRLNEKDQRIAANEEKKAGENQKYEAHQKEQNDDVDAHAEELKVLQAKYAEEKEQLLQEKKENEDRIAEEEGGLIKGRKEELEQMQSEKDEILKPTIEELEVETEKLRDLTDSKDQLSSEVESAQKLQEEYEAKIKELKEKLEETNNKIESATKEHEEYSSKREVTDKEVEDLQKSHDKHMEDTEKTHKELDDEIAALEKEKVENTEKKANHKKEILREIDDKVKGEHAINRELPEYMQDTVDEGRIRDVGSLFSAEEKKEQTPSIANVVSKGKEPVSKSPSKATKGEEATDASKKKKGFRSRLKDVIRVSSISPSKADGKSSSSTSKPTATSKSTIKSSDSKKDSTDMSNFEDPIADNRNKGGLFKEEI